jgi:hypothetical protein
MYGRGHREPVPRRSAVYHGVWGTNLFQTLYVRPPGVVASLPLLPEWYLLIAFLALCSVVGLVWPPALWSFVPLVLAVGVLLAQAITAAWRAPLPPSRGRRWSAHADRATIAWLHLLQPVMRLRGRLSYGLHPLRRGKGTRSFVLPRTRSFEQWSESWKSIESRLESLELTITRLGGRVRRGGPFDPWDLEMRGGLFGGVRFLMAIEEHGHGRQLVRFRSSAFFERWTLPLAAGLAGLAYVAFAAGSAIASTVFGGAAALVVNAALFDCVGASSIAQACGAGARDVRRGHDRVRRLLGRGRLDAVPHRERRRS